MSTEIHDKPRLAARLAGERTYIGKLPCAIHGPSPIRRTSNSQCLTCCKAYGAAYKAARADSERERKRAYKKAHPEKQRAHHHAYTKRHADKIAARAKAYRQADPHGTIAMRKAIQQAARATLKAEHARHMATLKALQAELHATPEVKRLIRLANTIRNAARLAAMTPAQIAEERAAACADYQRRKAADPERMAMAERRRRSKRRARLRALHEHATTDEILELLRSQGGHCAYCGKPAEHCDHKQALSQGGTDTIENMQWLCAPCNMHKRTTDDTTYRIANGIPPLTEWEL